MTDIDIEHLQTWVDRQETIEDDITLFPCRALAAALDHTTLPEKGDKLPPFWEWLFFLPTPTATGTGVDGHPKKGGFLPPVPLPRRMWAAGSAEYVKPLIIGKAAKRVSTIQSVELKQGGTGTLVFVNVLHEISQDQTLCIREVQNIVYREAPTTAAGLPPPKPAPAKPQWQKSMQADPVLLFRFSALTYNGHRIHYDRSYASEEELYPALVVHGPLLVTLLLDFKRQHIPAEQVSKIKFRAVRPTFDIYPFQLQGLQQDRQVKLWTLDQEDALGMSIDVELANERDAALNKGNGASL